jgi:hypothetical protein
MLQVHTCVSVHCDQCGHRRPVADRPGWAVVVCVMRARADLPDRKTTPIHPVASPTNPRRPPCAQ